MAAAWVITVVMAGSAHQAGTAGLAAAAVKHRLAVMVVALLYKRAKEVLLDMDMEAALA
jgi:translation initiation factor 2B subunit (eIF-2B alpha/beta/delta family)